MQSPIQAEGGVDDPGDRQSLDSGITGILSPSKRTPTNGNILTNRLNEHHEGFVKPVTEHPAVGELEWPYTQASANDQAPDTVASGTSGEPVLVSGRDSSSKLSNTGHQKATTSVLHSIDERNAAELTRDLNTETTVTSATSPFNTLSDAMQDDTPYDENVDPMQNNQLLRRFMPQPLVRPVRRNIPARLRISLTNDYQPLSAGLSIGQMRSAPLERHAVWWPSISNEQMTCSFRQTVSERLAEESPRTPATPYEDSSPYQQGSGSVGTRLAGIAEQVESQEAEGASEDADTGVQSLNEASSRDISTEAAHRLAHIALTEFVPASITTVDQTSNHVVDSSDLSPPLDYYPTARDLPIQQLLYARNPRYHFYKVPLRVLTSISQLPPGYQVFEAPATGLYPIPDPRGGPVQQWLQSDSQGFSLWRVSLAQGLDLPGLDRASEENQAATTLSLEPPNQPQEHAVTSQISWHDHTAGSASALPMTPSAQAMLPSSSRTDSIALTGQEEWGHNDLSAVPPATWWQRDHPQTFINCLARGEPVLSPYPGGWDLTKELNPPFYIMPWGSSVYLMNIQGVFNLHASLEHGIWCSTAVGNDRLQLAYENSPMPKKVLLMFSVQGSGRLCGMAEMCGALRRDHHAGIWKADLKGSFKIKWVYCKNACYHDFEDIPNEWQPHRPLREMRDATTVPESTGREVVKRYVESLPLSNIMMSTHAQNEAEGQASGRTGRTGYLSRRERARLYAARLQESQSSNQSTPSPQASSNSGLAVNPGPHSAVPVRYRPAAVLQNVFESGPRAPAATGLYVPSRGRAVLSGAGHIETFAGSGTSSLLSGSRRRQTATPGRIPGATALLSPDRIVPNARYSGRQPPSRPNAPATVRSALSMPIESDGATRGNTPQQRNRSPAPQ